MEISGKIMLMGLPAPLARALSEQLAGTDILTTNAGEAMLFICGAGDPDTRRVAVPVLPLRHDKPLRLGALLRQARQMVEEPALYLAAFRIGPYEFSPQEKTLSKNGSDDIQLTDKEVDILVHLARQSPVAVSREDLLKDVWRYQDGVDTHTLETHIYRLRQKIEEVADAPQILVTDGRGYRINL
ncbi:MAG: winged helix-turn-helix domain-containing protein [bacterium]|nr:winged helix-turn-helix domain-containing protein [bacterium]